MNTDLDNMVQIPVDKYINLLDDSRLLDALRRAGVDNWEGWDYAIDILNGLDE